MTSGVGALLADRYEIEALIGKGGMGAVYRARDRTLGELVALKSIVLDGLGAAEALRRFREEVRLARRVTHANVARVFDLIEDASGAVFLTMELVDGVTLRQLLAREGGPLPLARAVRIGVDVCAGLSAVHAAGIVHRDLKPTNILVEPSGRAVIADFGVARSMRDPRSLALGAVVGTPRYMAPEQAAGRPVDTGADVYALGVTLAELFYGQVPSNDRAPWMNEPAPLPELRRILSMCLRSESASRPSSEDVGSVLRAVAQHDDPVANRKNSGEPPRREPTIVSRGDPRNLESRLEHAPPTRASTRTPSEVTLVVLPFRLTTRDPGPAALGDVIADELTDALASTRGLVVLAPAAASRFRENRDPVPIGRELSAHVLIDGTLRMTGEDIALGVRLIDTRTGLQLWGESFSGSLGELFSFESAIVKRVAERLRLSVQLVPYGGVVPADAVRLYLDARAARRTPHGTGEMMELLGQALSLAPELRPAIAAHAMASLLAWFVPFAPTEGDWEKICAGRVERALAEAPDLPESHVAAATLAWEAGRAGAAVASLDQALRLAPTSIEAHALLGEMQARAGHPTQALTHLRLAHTLDETHFEVVTMLARHELFAGRYAEGMRLLDVLGGVYAPPIFLLRVTAAAWRGDEAEIRQSLDRAWALSDSAGPIAFGDAIARSFLGEGDPRDVAEMAAAVLALGKSPRLEAIVLSIVVEVFANRGRTDEANGYLQQLADNRAFIDLDWLEQSPGLSSLRDGDAFRSIFAVTRERVRAIPL